MLPAVVRDFQGYGATNMNGLDAHPDFQNCSMAETGIVATMLGNDSKPVYAKTSEHLARNHGCQALPSHILDARQW